jgi:hypothetical protein
LNITLTDYAPALFTSNSQEAGTVSGPHPDGNPITGNDPAFPTETIAFFATGPGTGVAQRGEIVILWATGLGRTTPAILAGMVVDRAANVTLPVTVTVGSFNAQVIGTALSPGLAGVYQVAIQLPTGVPIGEVLVRAIVGGNATPDNVYLYVN